jgi:hypothetical protein
VFHDAPLVIDAPLPPPPPKPAVAWVDSTSGKPQIYLRRWTGNTWEELGGSASGQGISFALFSADQPAVALTPEGNPVVAWVSRTAPMGASFEIYLKRWNGTAWEELGGSATVGGVSQSGNGYSIDPAVAIDRNGKIYVTWAYVPSGGGLRVYVKQWDGTSWGPLGASVTTGISGTNDGFAPAIRLDSTGAPIVAWNAEGAMCWIYVRRWDGTTWAELGTGSATGTGISGARGVSNPGMDIGADGIPVIAWWDNTSAARPISAREYVAPSWQNIGTTSTTGCTAGTQFPVAIDSNNHPNVASYPTGGGAFHVFHYDGTTWSELASAGGNDQPGLAAWQDNLLATWSATVGSDTEIYVKQWDGSSWSDLGGSATGTGISATTGGSSTEPAIATAIPQH